MRIYNYDIIFLIFFFNLETRFPYVAQAGLKLTATLLTQFLSIWDNGHEHLYSITLSYVRSLKWEGKGG